MASQLSSSHIQQINGYTWMLQPTFNPIKTVYFSRQNKGAFTPINNEEMASTKRFWMIHYRDNNVISVEYVKREPNGDCKVFLQCKNNLPKGIEAILFLMGLHFK